MFNVSLNRVLFLQNSYNKTFRLKSFFVYIIYYIIFSSRLLYFIELFDIYIFIYFLLFAKLVLTLARFLSNNTGD